jgi:hypothetical protein
MDPRWSGLPERPKGGLKRSHAWRAETMIGDGILDRILLVLLFAPLAVPAALLVLGLLCGLIRAAGLWRDSFVTADLSPVRIYQFAASLVGAAAILIALARTGATAFPPVPGWVVVAAGGGNTVYLMAKFAASRRVAARRPGKSKGG